MMLRTGVAALSIFALTTAAVAQEAGPITNREVVGEWTLTVTPADQSVSFESADGTSPDFPLEITRRGPVRPPVSYGIVQPSAGSTRKV